MSLSLFNEYKKNIRPIQLEEPFDYIFYRPLAFLVLKLTSPFNFLTPNHFSLLALTSAITSYYFLIKGTQSGLMIGGIGVFFFSVFDCCDGMLARMKKNGSKYGDLIDMFVDLLSSILFFTGLFIGLKIGLEKIYYLVWPAAISLLIHAGVYHVFKERYKASLEGQPLRPETRKEQYKRELSELKQKGGNPFHKLLLRLFLLFSKCQSEQLHVGPDQAERYVSLNKRSIVYWGAISGSTHLFILSFSLIFSTPHLYFIYAVILANIWLLFMTLYQIGLNKEFGIET